VPGTPIVFRSTHRIRFSELDPYDHVSTGNYAIYFVDHRMQGLRDNIGWDLATLANLPFMVWVRRMEIDFLRPTLSDQEITITSFVRDFQGADALIECTMADAAAQPLARCLMTVAYVEKATRRSAPWPPEVTALFFEGRTA